jgi:sigma-B regulation protein RsbU (phosphoserine phosphatase)
LAQLTEYLNLETLQHLQDAFSAVGCAPVRICGPDGVAITQPSVVDRRAGDDKCLDHPVAGTAQSEAAAPVIVDGQVIGSIQLGASVDEEGAQGVSQRQLRLIGLVTGVISRLCQREKQLRTRVDELATLYRLTAEFTSQRDLQKLLDQVARTVVDTMRAKACSIRLVSEDDSELVMKAVANLSDEYLRKGPVPISRSEIDRQAISTGEPVYIADLASDPRVLYPAESRREGIVSGLCAPMLYRGRAEGAIRVYMAERHEFDWFEVSLLKGIASQAAAAIVNARLYLEAIRSADVHRQLRLAGEVQRRMIPARPPKVEGLDIAAIYVPCFELAGDFYDFINLPKGNLGVAVCDVVGKGVRASLLTAAIRASLRAHATNIYDMADVLQRVNNDLCDDALSSDFATLFYSVIDTRLRQITYSNAGHIPPLLLRDGRPRGLCAGGGVLGIDRKLSWGKEVVKLRAGDFILMHTDGLHEATNFADEPFGLDRVQKAAIAAADAGQTAEGLAKALLWEMRRFTGLQTRFDDLTLICIKVL